MDETLRYALDHDMIDTGYLHDQVQEMKRKEYLSQHNAAISQRNDGKWMTYLPDERKGRIQKVRNSKEEIEELIIEYWKDQAENPTLEQYFREWNQSRVDRGKIQKSTAVRNQRVFDRHYSEFGKRKLRQLQPEDFQDFLEEQISEHHLNAKAFSNLRSITRGLLKYAKRHKMIDFNVDEMFQELDVSRDDYYRTFHDDEHEVFNEEEMPIIMDYLIANQDDPNLCLILMFVTGMRIGEATTLRHEDIHECYIDVRHTETSYMENGTKIHEVRDFAKTRAGMRSIVVPAQYSWLLEKIQSLHPDCEYVFTIPETKERILTDTVRFRHRRVCRQLGIPEKSPHKIRKTYSSILLDNNVDARFVIDQMGHTNINCDETYYHRNRRNIDRKQEILSRIPDFNRKVE